MLLFATVQHSRISHSVAHTMDKYEMLCSTRQTICNMYTLYMGRLAHLNRSAQSHVKANSSAGAAGVADLHTRFSTQVLATSAIPQALGCLAPMNANSHRCNIGRLPRQHHFLMHMHVKPTKRTTVNCNEGSTHWTHCMESTYVAQ